MSCQAHPSNKEDKEEEGGAPKESKSEEKPEEKKKRKAPEKDPEVYKKAANCMQLYMIWVISCLEHANKFKKKWLQQKMYIYIYIVCCVVFNFRQCSKHFIQAKLDNLALLRSSISDDPLAIVPTDEALGIHKYAPKNSRIYK